jgi:hypothetical protein
VNAAGSRRLVNEDRENIPLPDENLAAHAQPEDLQYVDMGYYGMGNDYAPNGHDNHVIGDDARITQDVPAQAQAAPPAPVCTNLVFWHAYT